MQHYRAASLAGQLTDLGISFHGDPTQARAGATAEGWQLVWASGYRLYTHPRTNLLAAMLLPEQILRVRPVDTSGDAAKGEKP